MHGKHFPVKSIHSYVLIAQYAAGKNRTKNNNKIVTLQIERIVEVRHRSVGDLLQDDSEAVDVSFRSSADRSSCHTQ